MNKEDLNFVKQEEQKEFEERVVNISRVTKVVKGGRRFRFAVIMIIGNKQGKVGFGAGKALEIPDAINKAIEHAKRNLIEIPVKKSTIPHEVTGIAGASRVFLKPSSEGTGVVAGGAVRTIFELAGINDILAKSIGSSTVINVVRATFDGLAKLTTLEKVAKLRGKKIGEII